MATIEIENGYLFKVALFLESVEKMGAKQSRARTKLVNALKEKGKGYVESQKAIVDNLGGSVGSDGMSITFPKEDPLAPTLAQEQLGELNNEVTIIEEEFVGQFETLKQFFLLWDGEVTSAGAAGYDRLMTILEGL